MKSHDASLGGGGAGWILDQEGVDGGLVQDVREFLRGGVGSDDSGYGYGSAQSGKVRGGVGCTAGTHGGALFADDGDGGFGRETLTFAPPIAVENDVAEDQQAAGRKFFEKLMERRLNALSIALLAAEGELFEGDADQLAAGTDAGFFEKLLDGGLHRAFRDAQAPADFLVAEALEDSTKNVVLAGGETLTGLEFGLGGELDYVFQAALVDPGFAGVDFANRVGEEGGRAVFEEDPGRALVQDLRGFGGGDAGGDDENARSESQGAHSGEKLGGAGFAEIVIEQDQIDTVVLKRLEGLIDGSAVGDHFEVRLGVQQTTQALAKQRMIVQKKQTHFAGPPAWAVRNRVRRPLR